LFRQVHREAVDKEGNPFYVVMAVNRKAGECSIRIWSADGQADSNRIHRYLPMKPQEEYSPLKKFLLKQFDLTVASKDVEIVSTQWGELKNTRTLEVVSSEVSETKGGFVDTTTYRQPWLDWEFTVVTVPCLSKQLAVDAKYHEFDTIFPSVRRLLKDDEADECASFLSWD
jgi:hypothetical protein